MARYRKLDTRTWSDEKFRRLSKPRPCGQVLWLYLLAGRETGIIPGVICAGPAALSESLEWRVEAFSEAFAEISSQGMAEFDFSARLIWIPNAIRYNKPESPNVIRSWRDAWDETPECDLKVKIWQQLKASCEGFGEAFAKAFTEACPKPFGKAMANQEQEQEQEQERACGAIAPSHASPKCAVPSREPSRTKRARKTALPEGFTISDRLRKWAAENGYSRLEERLEHFIAKAKAKGYQYVDWDAAFETAIRDDWAGFSKNGNHNGHGNRTNRNLAALDAAFPLDR